MISVPEMGRSQWGEGLAKEMLSTVASKHWGTRLSDRILIGNPEIRL
jgi:hypothetical protein